MPMTEAGLASAIQSAMMANVTPTNPAELTAFCQALGQAIVDYLKANAVISGVVESGAGAGGTVQGTLT